MGGRWVAAALVLLGIISSMNLHVEAQGYEIGDAELSDAKRIHEAYLKIVVSGKNVDQPCANDADDMVDTLAGFADKTPDEIKALCDKGPPNTGKMTCQNFAEKAEGYVTKAKGMCNMKKGLECNDGKCKACPDDSPGSKCRNLIKIKKAKDANKSGGGSGGWLVRPVDGALVAALLAVFAISA